MAKKNETAAEKPKKQPPTQLSINDLKSIFEMMQTNEIREVDLELGDLKLKITGKHAQQPVMVQAATSTVAAAPAPQVGTALSVEDAPAAIESRFIRSPMVGTFYGRPSPESSEFVKEGAAFSGETVVCLVEAMKLFNEIKAETSGRIVRTLVKDGSPVEYNQPLFEIE